MDEAAVDEVLRRCQIAVPAWRGHRVDEFSFDRPKGFSSFTIGVHAPSDVEPASVLYRQLAGKENAILDADTEKRTYLRLAEAGIAARCLHYERNFRIEEFYRGRSLTADDVFDPEIQRGIADELFRLHHLRPAGLPAGSFFELLADRWGAIASDVVVRNRERFPADEQRMCADLEAIFDPETTSKVMRCLPSGPTVFCHNDTYHGNVFLLDDGSIRLLDFEFSCMNHPAFDFANLFAETKMRHGLEDPPHFRIDEPRYTTHDIDSLIGFYLRNENFESDHERSAERRRLVAETERAIMLSDYMYAMAALPLALEPIQKIRFIPYAHARFRRFLDAWATEFSSFRARSPVRGVGRRAVSRKT